MKVGRILFRRSLTADALVPRNTSRRDPTSGPYGLKRIAGAIGKQISALKATVAKFKKMRLPLPMRRLPIFSTKEAMPSQTDRFEVMQAQLSSGSEAQLKSNRCSIWAQGLYLRTTWPDVLLRPPLKQDPHLYLNCRVVR